MAKSEIYGKQRTCLYITQGERGNLREKNTECFGSIESENTKCNSLKAPLKQFLGGPDRTMQALQRRPHTGTYKTAK